MVANDIVLWFSIIVIGLVVIWAVWMIRAYDKVNRND